MSWQNECHDNGDMTLCGRKGLPALTAHANSGQCCNSSYHHQFCCFHRDVWSSSLSQLHLREEMASIGRVDIRCWNQTASGTCLTVLTALADHNLIRLLGNAPVTQAAVYKQSFSICCKRSKAWRCNLHRGKISYELNKTTRKDELKTSLILKQNLAIFHDSCLQVSGASQGTQTMLGSSCFGGASVCLRFPQATTGRW